MDLDPFGAQGLGERLRDLGILGRQDPLHCFENDYAHPQPAEGLPQLQPDRSAADHDDAFRQMLQVHDRGAVEGSGFLQTRDRRHSGARPRGDDDLAALDLPFPHAHTTAAEELSSAGDERYALVGIQYIQVLLSSKPRDDLVLVPAHLSPGERGITGCDSGCNRTCGMEVVRRLDQVFARDASDVHARSANRFRPLHNGGGDAEFGRADRRGHAGSAASHDHEVVIVTGLQSG